MHLRCRLVEFAYDGPRCVTERRSVRDAQQFVVALGGVHVRQGVDGRGKQSSDGLVGQICPLLGNFAKHSVDNQVVNRGRSTRHECDSVVGESIRGNEGIVRKNFWIVPLHYFTEKYVHERSATECQGFVESRDGVSECGGVNCAGNDNIARSLE